MEKCETIEDQDPLVRAVGKKLAPDRIYRRPGLLKFIVALDGGGELLVTRSRFDGDYGDLARLVYVDENKTASKLTVATSEAVLAAMLSDDPAACLFEVYTRCSKRG